MSAPRSAPRTNGETVVDLWGGYADAAKTQPWEKDTIINVYSTTKTMTALTALLLADRGATRFRRAGRELLAGIRRQRKGRRQGQPPDEPFRRPLGLEREDHQDDLYDWEKATSLLAAQAPFWEPGTAPGYHALTQGYLVGEVIRRVTGKIDRHRVPRRDRRTARRRFLYRSAGIGRCIASPN